MKLKTRLFWHSGALLSAYCGLKAKARRAKRMPDFYSRIEKTNYFQKQAKKALNAYGIKLNVKGFENVPDSACLIIPNHSTYLDPIIMAYALSNRGDGEKTSKNFNFLAKNEVAKKKGIKLIAEYIETVFIDTANPREAVKTLIEFGKIVKENKTCGIVFAEGTRTRDGKIGTFQLGAFKIAQANFLPVVPVTINNAVNAMDKNRDAMLEVEVIFHPMLKPAQFQTVETKVYADYVQKIVEKDYKEQVITSPETQKNTYSKRD
ncbi:1-acyl-sn-glycerol-3-phosphate acyltransferase [Metamycoplasma subdolum]|uniref:1-acyl-sn-glycerol-3-phosphate acyltransferase n=1 Tax=Metamycoplasma subdolum TaxID=92407 RepID=A0A3M0A4T2_9BACT|nr:lysophospholipid acyltransferase family protein [Metamycoplasma subdolum]RMA77475.1 1-acyl-sn-glycerol-3-phosphate acyltransferase [Metamycoplasma subdolum]WPB50674.1 lysophospholipid acyltransferase family protein [Metamycoplasma subdolum]